jgi:hypothetical protein
MNRAFYKHIGSGRGSRKKQMERLIAMRSRPIKEIS